MRTGASAAAAPSAVRAPVSPSAEAAPHCGALRRRRWGLTSAVPTPPEMVTLGFLLAGGAVVTLTDVLTRWKSPWGHDAPPFPQEPACV